MATEKAFKTQVCCRPHEIPWFLFTSFCTEITLITYSNFWRTLLSGQPLLSGHLPFPRGWPLKRGSTVFFLSLAQSTWWRHLMFNVLVQLVVVHLTCDQAFFFFDDEEKALFPSRLCRGERAWSQVTVHCESLSPRPGTWGASEPEVTLITMSVPLSLVRLKKCNTARPRQQTSEECWILCRPESVKFFVLQTEISGKYIFVFFILFLPPSLYYSLPLGSVYCLSFSLSLGKATKWRRPCLMRTKTCLFDKK